MSKTFGERIKGLRRGMKKNQKELASYLGLSQTTIANYENNSRFPNDMTLIRLADYFHVSLDYLLGRTDDSSPFLTLDQRTQGARANQRFDSNWCERYLEALIRTDIKEAWRVLILATQLDNSLETVYDKILRPALYRAGELWQQGKLDVAQEHFITSETERFIALLRKKPSTITNGPLVVTFASGDDRHTLGIRMVSSALEATGYNVMFLGTQLPFSSLRFILNQYPVKVVAMSASNPVYINNISFMIKNLRESSSFDHISVIVGGQGFHGDPDLWKKVGADAYGDNTSIAVKMVSALLGR